MPLLTLIPPQLRMFNTSVTQQQSKPMRSTCLIGKVPILQPLDNGDSVQGLHCDCKTTTPLPMIMFTFRVNMPAHDYDLNMGPGTIPYH